MYHKQKYNFNLGPGPETYGMYPNNLEERPFDSSRSPGEVWGPDWHFNDPMIGISNATRSIKVLKPKDAYSNSKLGARSNSAGNSINVRPLRPGEGIQVNPNEDKDKVRYTFSEPADTEFKTTDEISMKLDEILNKLHTNQTMNNNFMILLVILLGLILFKIMKN